MYVWYSHVSIPIYIRVTTRLFRHFKLQARYVPVLDLELCECKHCLTKRLSFQEDSTLRLTTLTFMNYTEVPGMKMTYHNISI